MGSDGCANLASICCCSYVNASGPQHLEMTPKHWTKCFWIRGFVSDTPEHPARCMTKSPPTTKWLIIRLKLKINEV